VNKKENNRADLSSAIITDLSRAIEDLVSRRKRPEELEGIIDEAKTLARQWKDPYSAKRPKDRRPLFAVSNSTMVLLAGLVVALKRDHEFLERIRSRFPNELEELQSAVLYAQLREWGEAAAEWDYALKRPKPKPTPRQVSEEKRSKWHRSFRNSIEYQYGCGLVADLRKSRAFRGLSDAALQWLGATCLDKIFAGDPVNMQGLEELFWMDRCRFPTKELLSLSVEDRRDRRKRVYGWRAVRKIMDFLLRETREFLLKEKSGKRKQPVLGPPRKLWLYDPKDPDLLLRVLKGIEASLNSLSVDDDIKAEFMKVIRRYLPDSAKK